MKFAFDDSLGACHLQVANGVLLTGDEWCDDVDRCVMLTGVMILTIVMMLTGMMMLTGV